MKTQEENLDCPFDFTSRCTLGRCDCKSKQETLEKALYNEFMDNPTISSKDREVFIKGGLFGAKWQQEQEKITTDDAYNEGFENGKHWQAERSYSEEELQQKIDAHLEVAKDLWLSTIKEQERSYSFDELRLWLIERDIYLYNYYTTYKKSGIPMENVDKYIEDSHEYLMGRKQFKKK